MPEVSSPFLTDLGIGVSPPSIPNVVIPEPFILANQDKGDLGKIVSVINDRSGLWETEMSGMFGEFEEYANSWRMIPKTPSAKKPQGLFNSKSGETNRATNTLATIWLRILTAADPFFSAQAEGLDEFGREVSEEDIYGSESVIDKQLKKLQFKRKLLKSLRSIALFGSAIVEEPWISLPFGWQDKYFEGTDFRHRSLLQTGFDPFIFELEQSDYVFTIDFVSDDKLREFASNNSEVWDKDAIERIIGDKETALVKGARTNTSIFNRIISRKQRAGYNVLSPNINELIIYHGKLNSNNSILQNLWQSLGRIDDIKYTDWTVGILNGQEIVSLYPTPYGTWHHRFKVAHFNEFELEPIGYGVGKIGRKAQNELDVTISRSNDILMFALYCMWKVGRYAGLKANQLNIKPWNLVELDDIEQLEAIRPQIEAINQAVQIQNNLKEDFRSITGATANLQAAITKATATEASLTQNESIRGVSVIAEIISEIFVREHIETMHINNLDFMDNDMWVYVTGQNKQKSYNRTRLPRNIGWKIKTVGDKDYKPERMVKLVEILQILTSIRNMPPNLNIIPFFEEAARGIGINPRKLRQQQPMADQILNQIRKEQRQRQVPELMDSMKGAMLGEMAGGGGANVSDVPSEQIPA